MKLRNILVSLMGITMLISACSNNATDSEVDILERESEYGDLPNKLNEAQTKIEVATVKKEYSTQVNELILKIENTGTTTVGFDLPLYIEKLINGTWYQIPYKNFTFADITLGTDSNSHYEQAVPLEHLDYQLTEGSYRIIKAFYVNEGESVLGAQFDLKE
ncbi:immunoglobulin-like domain-containing protein [Ureibacillus sp. GCM10028918]|uniref:immunoglobulin-like domain-containing protein n=1 Tax=Ureibacillus sp. GCM10028918 TaxID=3273429 RepID=UPI00361448A1